jgi:uncharacterized SAM-binding protein YcdF (DUF218 family)
VAPTIEIARQRPAAASSRRRSLGWWVWLLIPIVFVLGLLHWGGYLLIANDPMPAHADGAVVLQGSIEGEKLRIAAAMNLAQSENVARILLSVPKESYWGQSIPPVARQYLQRKYGSSLANRVDFCETDQGVDSTEEEAQSLIKCIQEHNWKEILIVTSNYHTRRAGIIWKRIARRTIPSAQVYVYGAVDPDFVPEGYWRHRRFLKTWLMESLKLTSVLAGT